MGHTPPHPKGAEPSDPPPILESPTDAYTYSDQNRQSNTYTRGRGMESQTRPILRGWSQRPSQKKKLGLHTDGCPYGLISSDQIRRDNESSVF